MLFPKTSLNRKFTVLLNYLPKNGGDPHVYIHSGGPGLNPFWPHMFRRSCGYLWNCNHAETNNAGNSINSTTLYTKNACTRNKIHHLLSTFSFSKISKIKKDEKIFPISFLSHFDWWGIYYKNLWESVWYFFFHESYQLFRSIYSFKNNWEIKTLIKPSVELKT